MDIFMNISLRGSRTLGDYVLVGEVGESTLSTYYFAVHELKRTNHIVRAVRKERIKENGDIRDLIFNEIKALQSHDHPSIAPLCHLFEDSECAFIVTAYVPGPCFISALLANRLGEVSKARRAFHQIVNIAMFLEVNNVRHMFRLEHIVRACKEKLVLVDFNPPNATITDALLNSCRQTCVRPLIYRAPEILEDNVYTTCGNAWACGIALCLLLTGQLPFNPNLSDRLLKQRIRKAPVSPPSWLSFDARELISSLLERNASERLPLREIPQHPWFAAGVLEYNEGSMFWEASSIHVSSTSSRSSTGATAPSTPYRYRHPQAPPRRLQKSMRTYVFPSDFGGPLRRGDDLKRDVRAQLEVNGRLFPTAFRSTKLDNNPSPSPEPSPADRDEERMLDAQRIVREEAERDAIRPRTSTRRSESRSRGNSLDYRGQNRLRPFIERFVFRNRSNRRWRLRFRSPITIHKYPEEYP